MIGRINQGVGMSSQDERGEYGSEQSAAGRISNFTGEGVRHSSDWHRPRKITDATMSEFQPSALQCARSVLPALWRDRERPTESHSVHRHASRQQAARPVSLLHRLRRETHRARGLA